VTLVFWVRLLISFGLITIYPILFFFVDHNIEDLEILIAMFTAYYLGIYLSLLYFFRGPIASLKAGNERDRFGRRFILINGLLMSSFSVYFLLEK